jgi:hypothetical protein
MLKIVKSVTEPDALQNPAGDARDARDEWGESPIEQGKYVKS